MNIFEEAVRITDEAKKDDVCLRIMGANAVRFHCERFRYLLDAMERKLSDIDFMAYSKQRKKINEFFIKQGYNPNIRFIATHAGIRHIYERPDGLVIDVFFDKLDMCHTIDFRNRLELDYPTITLADLLLQKMQVVKIDPKDIKDTIVMIREHEIGESENEILNAKYVANLLSKDWGFYYTVKTNLKKVKEAQQEWEILREDDHKDISSKIERLLDVIENEPKTFKWKTRAKIGTKKMWYREVEEVRR